jgi:hypothetical protein
MERERWALYTLLGRAALLEVRAAAAVRAAA